MRISEQHITNLQALLKEVTGKEYSREQAQEAGIAIMRFAAAKLHSQFESTNGRNNGYGKFNGKEAVSIN